MESTMYLPNAIESANPLQFFKNPTIQSSIHRNPLLGALKIHPDEARAEATYQSQLQSPYWEAGALLNAVKTTRIDSETLLNDALTSMEADFDLFLIISNGMDAHLDKTKTRARLVDAPLVQKCANAIFTSVRNLEDSLHTALFEKCQEALTQSRNDVSKLRDALDGLHEARETTELEDVIAPARLGNMARRLDTVLVRLQRRIEAMEGIVFDAQERARSWCYDLAHMLRYGKLEGEEEMETVCRYVEGLGDQVARHEFFVVRGGEAEEE
jgi:hypothetical protein